MSLRIERLVSEENANVHCVWTIGYRMFEHAYGTDRSGRGQDRTRPFRGDACWSRGSHALAGCDFEGIELRNCPAFLRGSHFLVAICRSCAYNGYSTLRNNPRSLQMGETHERHIQSSGSVHTWCTSSRGTASPEPGTGQVWMASVCQPSGAPTRACPITSPILEMLMVSIDISNGGET